MSGPGGVAGDRLRSIVERIERLEEEIKALVETGEEQGVLEETERDMIRSIFDLGDKEVHELMVPRTEIVAVDVKTPPEDILERVVLVGHSRLPIFEGSADQIIGVLYVKDIFRRIARGQGSPALRELLRPAHFVPETKKVDELLREMQQQKNHMAIVVDEYGGTAGLVTLEDIVEEIVGEIRDEYDVNEEQPIQTLSDHEAVVDARIPLRDVNEALHLHLNTDEFDTLGGLVYHELGKVPVDGDEIRVNGCLVSVISTQGRRLKKLRVTLVDDETG